MTFVLPAVDAASLAAWCEVHLGRPAESELFRTGHLTRVIGARLADGREVVVKVRRPAARIAACTEVQRRLFGSGYPCPQPLTGPAREFRLRRNGSCSDYGRVSAVTGA